MRTKENKEIIQVNLDDLISEVKEKEMGQLIEEKKIITKEKINKVNLFNNIEETNEKESKEAETDAEVVARELGAIFAMFVGFMLFNLKLIMTTISAAIILDPDHLHNLLVSLSSENIVSVGFVVTKVIGVLYILLGIKKLIVDDNK